MEAMQDQRFENPITNRYQDTDYKSNILTLDLLILDSNSK